MELKVPTAYIVPPHCASWRTCSVAPVFASCGVPAAGVDDTGPVAAWAGAADHANASTAADARHARVLIPGLKRPIICLPPRRLNALHFPDVFLVTERRPDAKIRLINLGNLRAGSLASTPFLCRSAAELAVIYFA